MKTFSTQQFVEWAAADPEKLLKAFEDKHVTDLFAEEDKAGPAVSDVVATIALAMRHSLNARYVIALPEGMNNAVERLNASGLYGHTSEETLERLAAERILQLVDDDSRLLATDGE